MNRAREGRAQVCPGAPRCERRRENQTPRAVCVPPTCPGSQVALGSRSQGRRGAVSSSHGLLGPCKLELTLARKE